MIQQLRSKLLILLILSFTLTGCGLFGGGDDNDEFAGLSTEEQFYRRALDQLNSNNFNGAIATYQALESRFPFGRFAAQAQVEIVIRLYPGDIGASVGLPEDRAGIVWHIDTSGKEPRYSVLVSGSGESVDGLAEADLQP